MHNYIIDDQIHTMEFTIKPDKNSQKITLCSVSISNPIYFIYSERQQPKLLLLFTTHQPLFCFWLTIPWHYSVSLFQSVPIISNHTGNSVKEILHCFAKSFHNLTYFVKQCKYYIFMISNNYNQTLYSFQVVVYFLKMHKILTMYFKNTDAKYRYILPPSHFFEIILSFFRNYLYMG